MSRMGSVCGVLLFFGLMTAASACADDRHLLGDWGGSRAAMEKVGLTAEAVLTTDFLYNADGGIRRDGAILGNVDLTFELDAAKAGWWENGTFFLYFG